MRKIAFPNGFYSYDDVTPAGAADGTAVAEIRVSNHPSDDAGKSYRVEIAKDRTGLRLVGARVLQGDRFRSIPATSDVLPVLEAVLRTQSTRDRQSAFLPLDIEWGSHVIVSARPFGRRWSRYDGTNGLSDHRTVDEFRPCMVRGVDRGQSLYVIGSQYAYPLDEFEIVEPRLAAAA